MTTKKKLIIAGVAVAVAVVWGVCGIVFQFNTFPSPRGLSSYRGASGTVLVTGKDFEPLELVFVTATAKKGDDVDIKDLLLKEAKKLGGHGITNVTIDSQRKSSSKDVTWTGSALAIKYTDAVGEAATESGLASPTQRWSGFGWGRR
jgi:hypothetical protein